MDYKYLYPVLEKLSDKYMQLGFSEWACLHSRSEQLNDYSDHVHAPSDEVDMEHFWQAHTDVLEIAEDEKGRYALVSTVVYPWGIHTSPPAPSAALVVYESGNCEVLLPWKKLPFGNCAVKADKGD